MTSGGHINNTIIERISGTGKQHRNRITAANAENTLLDNLKLMQLKLLIILLQTSRMTRINNSVLYALFSIINKDCQI